MPTRPDPIDVGPNMGNVLICTLISFVLAGLIIFVGVHI